jgi:hypothetical protein
VNAEFVCGLVEQTFVAEELQLVPRRHSDSILRRQQVMMLGYQCDSMIICRKKQPVFEPVFFAETEKEINFRAVVSGHPRNVATNIP